MGSKIFVGNLSFDTTREELEQLFQDAGQIVSVAVPTDRATGQPRGFAFVEFSDSAGAQAAIQKFDGQELNGRGMRVSEAQERQPGAGGGGRPSGGGGGGYGAPRPGGFSQDRPAFRPRPKGSRRNVRAKKRGF